MRRRRRRRRRRSRRKEYVKSGLGEDTNPVVANKPLFTRIL